MSRDEPGPGLPPGEPPGRGWYPASRPLAAEGGIRARSQRGSIGEQWWSRRFIDVLESFGLSGRLQRGRRYARAGQVLDLQIAAGYVSGLVQGSRPAPYKVRIQVLPLTTRQWHSVEQALAARALFRARLLAGEMPAQIEEVFAACGTPLFPRSAHDLDMRCSCPDWGVPCKHLAAVCYVLAERFDDDPFQVLAWRGRGRDALLAALRRPPVGQQGPGAGAGALTGAPAGPADQAALTGQVVLTGLAAHGRPPGPAGGVPAGAVPAGGVPAGLGPGGPGTPAGIDEPLTAALDRPAAAFWTPGLSVARLRAEDPGPAVPPDLLLRVLEPPPVRLRGPGLATVLTPAYLRLGAGAEGPSPDGSSPDGASADGASPDGASLDGASLDGASADGLAPGESGGTLWPPAGQAGGYVAKARRDEPGGSGIPGAGGPGAG